MLRDATFEVLQQLATLINSVGDHYAEETADGSSSIGRHVRHILDHFVALKLAMVTGNVNYNSRSRDSVIEVEPKAALIQIERLVRLIGTTNLEDRALTVESEVSLTCSQNLVVDSSLHREICYVINHAVHHIAYASLLAQKNGLAVDRSLGVAPATATHFRNTVRLMG